MSAQMTDAQMDACDRANEILGEHFDRHVIVLGNDIEIDGVDQEICRVTWRGGFASALGMLEYGRNRLTRYNSAKRREAADGDDI